MTLRSTAPALAFLVAALSGCSAHFEGRDMPAQLRRGYNNAFFHRHNDAFRTSAAIHYRKAHDVLQGAPLADAYATDIETDADFARVLRRRMRMEPSMMLFGPHTGQGIWRLYLAIDWTHHHHEQTYDILSDADVPWEKKADVTRDAVDYYLARSDAAQPGATRSHDAPRGGHDEAVLRVLPERVPTHERLLLRATLEFGFPRNAQITIATPVKLVDFEKVDLGRFSADAFYDLNQETLTVLAFALGGGVEAPTGKDTHGFDPYVQVYVSKLLPTFDFWNGVHVDGRWQFNTEKIDDERPGRYRFAAGYAFRVSASTIAIADYVRDQMMKVT